MKAITIRQPYALLIMAGIKTLETRSRPTKLRGRVLIHSALTDATLTDALSEYLADWIRRTGSPGILFHYGHILGSVEITDCLPAGDWIEANRMKDRNADYEREWILGDLSSDNYVYILKDPIPLKEPFKWKGQQSVGWEFPLEKLPQSEPIAVHL